MRSDKRTVCSARCYDLFASPDAVITKANEYQHDAVRTDDASLAICIRDKFEAYK